MTGLLAETILADVIGTNVIDWFGRFGDIPGVIYETPSDVEREQLPRHNDVPEVHVYEVEGERRESLWWPGSGGASPAHGRAYSSATTTPTTTTELLKNCFEGLELPGQPSDYHFLIQGSADVLWKRRCREPQVLDHVEKLCWLDIQLIRACPDTVRYKSGDRLKFIHVLSFGILILLYEREGFLREALEVAEEAARYGQGTQARDRLNEQIASLENESHE